MALVTTVGVDVAATDDKWLLAVAAEARVDVTVVRWDDPCVDWAAFGIVWLRSCWDYHLRYEEFLGWLARADASGAHWVNALPLVLHNSHKEYLERLRTDGVSVAPLRLVRRGAPFDTVGFLAETNWPDVVIKPAVCRRAGGRVRVGECP